MYLDGKGAELATIGDVGVLILVVAVGVEIVVDDVGVDTNLGRSMTVLFVFGELKSNDNRDL